MSAVRYIVISVGLLLAANTAVGAQQPLKIGTKVGEGQASGYDSGGRRDPFASLIAEQTAVVEAEGKRAKGLAGVAVVDVVVTGIITSGKAWLAIVAGPDGAMYIARTNDRLHDAVIRRIDRESVVFFAKVTNGAGDVVSREVRKTLRPATGAGR